MCGRAACTLAPQEIKDRLGAEKWDKQELYKPSFNVSPTKFQPVLVFDNERVLRSMKWGGVGHTDYNTINARVESLLTSSLWHRLVKTRRCVVVASGYFEWTKEGGKKKPHYVHYKDKPLITMAGIYDEATVADGEKEGHYAIITTDCAKDISWLHDRMPVILDTDEKIDMWLNPENTPEKLLHLLRPLEGLECYEVPQVVNSNKNDTADCIRKMDDFKKTGGIAAFFNRVPPPPKKEVKSEDVTVKVKAEPAAPIKSEGGDVKVATENVNTDKQESVKREEVKREVKQEAIKQEEGKKETGIKRELAEEEEVQSTTRAKRQRQSE